MGKLTLIGLGLFDEKDLTLRGIEEAKIADRVYIELYTSKWHGDLGNLKKLINRDIIELQRKDLEENSKEILRQAKNGDIAILVQGDPLVATTHTSLLLDAKNLGIETKIIHNASIVSAIAESGLHIYKFGPIVTIPFPEKTKEKLPESIYETIKENKERGLHTLCLLDVVAEENRYMSVGEAIKILLNLEKEKRTNVFTEDTEIVVLSRVGGNDSKISYGKVKDLVNINFKELPSVLIISGKLHFTEKEYLELV